MIPFDNWGGVDQDALRRLALDPMTRPLVYRLMFAAMGWSNKIGHAEFGRGELVRHMQVVTSTGELVTVSASTLSNELATARARGLIGEGSTARCLVTPEWFAKTGGRGGTACKHHGITARRR